MASSLGLDEFDEGLFETEDVRPTPKSPARVEEPVEEPFEEPPVERDEKFNAEEGFEQFDLPAHLYSALADMGWTRPLPVQAQALPVLLADPPQNLIAQAETGKGKTGAFSLAMLARVDTSVQAPQVICVAPTREIALQTAEYTLLPLTKGSSIRVLRALKDEAISSSVTEHVIVGTPGTVIRILKQGGIDLSHVKVLVIDEADSMVDEGREKPRGPRRGRGGRSGNGTQRSLTDSTQLIKRMLPPTAQIMLFSATFSKAALRYAHSVAPAAFELIFQQDEEQQPVKNVKQFVFHCQDENEKFDVLQRFYMCMDVGNVLIFVNTKASVRTLTDKLQAQGLSVAMFHGGLSPTDRDRMMKDFRDGKHSVLVATNVLARGLDVPLVNFVVNYDVPLDSNRKPDSKEFIHRVGRAGRLDRKGIAIAFSSNSQSRSDLGSIISKFPELDVVELHASDDESFLNAIQSLKDS